MGRRTKSARFREGEMSILPTLRSAGALALPLIPAFASRPAAMELKKKYSQHFGI
jgi:hypothetical protein